MAIRVSNLIKLKGDYMKNLPIGLFIVLAFTSSLYARLAIVTLDEAVKDKDLIIIGTLRYISERYEEDGTYGEGTIVVEKFIAGNVKTENGMLLKSGDKLHLNYAETFPCVMGWHKRIENEKGVFLLKLNDAGEIQYKDFRSIEDLTEIKKLLKKGIRPSKLAKTIKIFDENVSSSQPIFDRESSKPIYCDLVADSSGETDYSTLRALLVILASIRLYRFLYRSRFKIR